MTEETTQDLQQGTQTDNPVQDQVVSGPSAKQIAAHEAEVKRVRKKNKEGLEDFEVQVRYDTLQAETVVQRLRAMKAFLEVEALLPDYLVAVENKKKKDAERESKPLIEPVSNPIITSVN